MIANKTNNSKTSNQALKHMRTRSLMHKATPIIKSESTPESTPAITTKPSPPLVDGNYCQLCIRPFPVVLERINEEIDQGANSGIIFVNEGGDHAVGCKFNVGKGCAMMCRCNNAICMECADAFVETFDMREQDIAEMEAQLGRNQSQDVIMIC